METFLPFRPVGEIEGKFVCKCVGLQKACLLHVFGDIHNTSMIEIQKVA